MTVSAGWLAAIVVAALLVGALLPIFVLLAMTLRDARRVLAATGSRLQETLESTSILVQRVEKVSRGLEGGEEKVAELMRAVGEVGEIVDRLKSSMRVATAVGSAVAPAVAAFVSAMRSPALAAHESNGGGQAGEDECVERQPKKTPLQLGERPAAQA